MVHEQQNKKGGPIKKQEESCKNKRECIFSEMTNWMIGW